MPWGDEGRIDAPSEHMSPDHEFELMRMMIAVRIDIRDFRAERSGFFFNRSLRSTGITLRNIF